MLQLLRRYLRLMRTHDFSYWYSDDNNFWFNENIKRKGIIGLRAVLVLTARGREFVTLAERRYGHV